MGASSLRIFSPSYFIIELIKCPPVNNILSFYENNCDNLLKNVFLLITEACVSLYYNEKMFIFGMLNIYE